MMKKISLFLLTSTFSITALAQYNYQPVNRDYPPLNTSQACGIYNQLHAGMPINLVQNIVNPPVKTEPMPVGKTYQWITQSGYKFVLNFYNNGQPMGMTPTASWQIMFVPYLKQDSAYYSYGVITPNERKFMKLASTRKFNLKVAQQLLGTYGTVIGDVYQYKFANRWFEHSTFLTVKTTLHGKVTDFAINVYCGDNNPLILI